MDNRRSWLSWTVAVLPEVSFGNTGFVNTNVSCKFRICSMPLSIDKAFVRSSKIFCKYNRIDVSSTIVHFRTFFSNSNVLGLKKSIALSLEPLLYEISIGVVASSRTMTSSSVPTGDSHGGGVSLVTVRSFTSCSKISSIAPPNVLIQNGL